MANSIAITFLGTASAQPSSTRNMSSLCMQMDGDVWMFDCGEGTQHQVRKTDVRVSKISAIFITHNHGDHLFGLPGLLCTLSGGISEEGKIIDLFGPTGIRAYIRSSLAISASFLTFHLRVHELLAMNDSPSCSEEGALPFEIIGRNILPDPNTKLWTIPPIDIRFKEIIAGPLSHSVPSIGYVLQEESVAGSLDASLVKPRLLKNKEGFLGMGIKNPLALMGQIKAGKTIQLPDGTSISPCDVVGPPKIGRKFCILGDTCNSDSLLHAARDATVLVHEATNAKVGDEQKTMEEVEASAISHGHSTPQMAGRFATAIHANSLLLNHFSARYYGDQSESSLAIMKEIENLAAGEFQGKIITSHDFLSVPILRPKA